MKYLLTVVLLTTTGELQTNSGPVEDCPPQEEMDARIKSLKEAGIVKDFAAYCIQTKFPMNPDGSPIKGTDI